jgi:protein dithiol oxidoreductase (disulfide-forming)
MRSLRFALLATVLAASTAVASPSDPKNGVDYVTLAQPQPVQPVGKKVEVIEFFMYHCPHCNALEPQLEQWVKKQGDNIHFKRIHLPFSGANDPEAHLYLTLEAMGKAEEFQPKVFKAWHVDHLRLNTDAAILDWVSKNGIDRNKFQDVWNSFGVTTKLRRLPQITTDYKVDGVPTLIVDGKYQTSPSIVYNSIKTTSEPVLFQATLQVMDALVAKAAKSK